MLPETGAITMDNVRTELKKTGTISLNDSDVRKLAKIESGTISMNDLRGKKANEEVTDYVFLDNERKAGVGTNGTITITPPHKIIQGKLKLTTNSSNNRSKGNITIFGVTYENQSAEIEIENITSINISYYTGSRTAGSNVVNGYVYITVTFTGEWEVE